jgi:uncharacterized protein
MEFSEPFPGMCPEEGLSDEDLCRAIRLDIAAEEDAIHLYVAHAGATDCECAKKVLNEIADDERVHVGQLQELLAKLEPDDKVKQAEGAAEMHKIETESYIKAAQKGGSKNPSAVAKQVQGENYEG